MNKVYQTLDEAAIGTTTDVDNLGPYCISTVQDVQRQCSFE
jgi:hypothetical protein